MANVLSKGALFPPIITNELISKVRGKSSIAALCDAGEIERVVCDELAPAVDAVEALLK